MTAAELRVLEARMDMLDAVLRTSSTRCAARNRPAGLTSVSGRYQAYRASPSFRALLRWLRTGSKMVPPMS
jgi:hypothetical protein